MIPLRGNEMSFKKNNEDKALDINDTKSMIDNDNILIINNQKIFNEYSVDISDEIGEPKAYRELFFLLRNASNQDVIVLYINSPGGNLDTGISIINAIRSCPGRVASVLTGPVCSMAPLIALVADKVFVEEDVYMMFHDYSGGAVGKGNEQLAQIKVEKAFYDELFKRIVKGFLNTKEINRILTGSDLYLDRSDIIKRLKKLGKLGNPNKEET
jgi:ATP-dependent protease ClpP protease subunit